LKIQLVITLIIVILVKIYIKIYIIIYYMSQSFNSFSYLSGILTGMIIKWTDIIPIIGGFCLGLAVKNLPELFDINELPNIAKNYFMLFKSRINKNK